MSAAHAHRDKRKKAQSSVEYLSVYGFAIAIVVLALALIYIFINSSGRQVPNSCDFASTITCRDAVVGASGSASTNTLLLLTDSQQYPIINPSLKLSVQGGSNMTGQCIPSYVLPGATILCNATTSGTYTVGGLVTETLYLGGITCVSGNPMACNSLPQETFLGKLNGQYQQVGPLADLTIALVAANSVTQRYTPDRIVATVMLGQMPLGSAGLNFTSNLTSVAFSPRFEVTDNNGNATAYAASSDGGNALVTASFGTYSASAVIDFSANDYVTFAETNTALTSNLLELDGVSYATSQLPITISGPAGAQVSYGFNSSSVNAISGCGLTSISGIFTIMVNCTVVANPTAGELGEGYISGSPPLVSINFDSPTATYGSPDLGTGSSTSPDTLIMCSTAETGGEPSNYCPAGYSEIVATGVTNGGIVQFDTKVAEPNGDGYYFLPAGTYTFVACDVGFYVVEGVLDCSSGYTVVISNGAGIPVVGLNFQAGSVGAGGTDTGTATTSVVTDTVVICSDYDMGAGANGACVPQIIYNAVDSAGTPISGVGSATMNAGAYPAGDYAFQACDLTYYEDTGTQDCSNSNTLTVT